MRRTVPIVAALAACCLFVGCSVENGSLKIQIPKLGQAQPDQPVLPPSNEIGLYDAPGNGIPTDPNALPPGPTPATTAPQTLGELSAIQTVKAKHVGYEAMVSSHTGDWSEAVIAAGPKWNQWIMKVRVRWNGSAYQIVSEEGPGAPPGSGPGQAAALAAGKARHSGWAATINSHSNDWTEVVVKMGPQAGKWKMLLRFRWDGSKYTFVREAAIVDQPKTVDRASLAIACAKARYRGYTAKIVWRASDWSGVTVWVGPPNSEWTHYVHVVWNGSRYYVDETDVIETGGDVSDDEGYDDGGDDGGYDDGSYDEGDVYTDDSDDVDYDDEGGEPLD